MLFEPMRARAWATGSGGGSIVVEASSKIELFARKTREGWAAAGNEIEGGFVDLADRAKSF